MDKDRVKGAAKEMEGKVERAAGDLTGNANTQAKGAAKEVEGKVQKKVGQAKDGVRKAIK